jgi:hypothetical protein
MSTITFNEHKVSAFPTALLNLHITTEPLDIVHKVRINAQKFGEIISKRSILIFLCTCILAEIMDFLK